MTSREIFAEYQTSTDQNHLRFDFLKEAKRLEKDVFPQLVEHRKLFGYMFAGQWFDVGEPEIYKQAVKEWK